MAVFDLPGGGPDPFLLLASNILLLFGGLYGGLYGRACIIRYFPSICQEEGLNIDGITFADNQVRRAAGFTLYMVTIIEMYSVKPA